MYTTLKRFACAFALAAAALVALPSMAYADVTIDETTFPDDNFRGYVQNTLNSGSDVLTDATLDSTASITVVGKQIASLTGIEYFTNLKTLICNENKITTLDLSNNTSLENLTCQDNLLTSLDLTGITGLKALYCYNNQLDSLDVSGNASLTIFQCENNLLTSLDVSGATSLGIFYCDRNKLTSLDVSDSTGLKFLDCTSNSLYDVVLGSASPISIDGTNQSLTVPVAFDQATGTYKSKQPLPLDGSHALSFTGSDIVYTNGFLQSDDPTASDTFTTSLGGGSSLSGTITLTISSFNVNFVDWDGTVLKSDSVEEGRAATAPADPARDGHTFTGWDSDFSRITSDLAVNALYEKNAEPAPAPGPADSAKPAPTAKNTVKKLAKTGDDLPWQLLLAVPLAAAGIVPLARKRMK